MATTQTFGVDQTYVQTFLPQVVIDSVGPLTPTRLTSIIRRGAAQLQAVIETAYGAGAAADIAALGSTDSAYESCQGLILDLCAPSILRAAHHLDAEGELDRYDALRDEALKRLRMDPRAAIGYQTPDDVSPGVFTSTDGLGLDTTAAARRIRRRFDGARGDKDEDQYIT